MMTCYHQACQANYHRVCLAKELCKEDGHLIPINGACPSCGQDLLWGELVKRYKQSSLEYVDGSQPCSDYEGLSVVMTTNVWIIHKLLCHVVQDNNVLYTAVCHSLNFLYQDRSGKGNFYCTLS